MSREKTLHRIPSKGKVFGVCAGLAEYFDIDVAIIRVVFVMLVFVGGSAIPFYIILAVILPSAEEKAKNIAVDSKIEQLGEELIDGKQTKSVRYALGLSLLAIGTWLLLGQFFPEIFSLRWDILWPAFLITSGLFIIFNKKD